MSLIICNGHCVIFFHGDYILGFSKLSDMVNFVPSHYCNYIISDFASLEGWDYNSIK